MVIITEDQRMTSRISNDNADDNVVCFFDYAIARKKFEPTENDSELKTEMLTGQLDFLTYDIIGELCDALTEEEGFGHHEPEQFMLDMKVVSEFLKACIYRDRGLSHPFHEIMDKMVKPYPPLDAET